MPLDVSNCSTPGPFIVCSCYSALLGIFGDISGVILSLSWSKCNALSLEIKKIMESGYWQAFGNRYKIL